MVFVCVCVSVVLCACVSVLCMNGWMPQKHFDVRKYNRLSMRVRDNKLSKMALCINSYDRYAL